MQHPEVRARINELQGRVAEVTVKVTALTKASIIENLVDQRDKAAAAGQYTAAIRANELLGKALGMFVEKTEIGRPGDFDDINDPGELIEGIARELKKLGQKDPTGQLLIGQESSGSEPS